MSTSRALSLLAACASPVFMLAAIAGWLTGVWPANPLTLGTSALLVVGGPVLGLAHLVMVRPPVDEVEEAVTELLAPPLPPPRAAARPEVSLTPRLAAAHAFHDWRDNPHPAIEQRDRARRAQRYLRSP